MLWCQTTGNGGRRIALPAIAAKWHADDAIPNSRVADMDEDPVVGAVSVRGRLRSRAFLAATRGRQQTEDDVRPLSRRAPRVGRSGWG